MGHTATIINGIECPGVTEILGILHKKSLASWREYVGKEAADLVMSESAARGRKLHEMVELFLKGGTVVLCGEDEELRPVFKAWFEWWKDSKLNCIEQETKVISPKHKYGGTLDAVVVDPLAPNDKIIVDWKFSNKSDHFRWLQLAGYARAYYEQTGTKIKSGMIVRIDKKAKVHVQETDKLWKYVPIFLALRKVFDFTMQIGKFIK